jgi:hypothetical protein
LSQTGGQRRSPRGAPSRVVPWSHRDAVSTALGLQSLPRSAGPGLRAAVWGLPGGRRPSWVRDAGERIVREGCRTPVPTAGGSGAAAFCPPSARTGLALQLLRPGQRPHCGQARHRAVTSPFGSISIGWMAAVHGKPHSIARRFSRLAPMNLFVSGCPAEEQPAGRHELNRCGCSRKLGAAQLLPLVAAATPRWDSIEAPRGR